MNRNIKSFSICLLFNLFFLFHYSEAYTNSTDKSIVIIGGGAAGIAAATKLLSNGFKNIIILEAQNRIGGRVNTIPYGENVVDMGGQWCNGQEGNIVYEMAKDKNLLAFPELDYKVFNCFHSNGTQIGKEIADKLTQISFEIIDGFDDEKKLYNGSIGNFFAEKYWNRLQDNAFKVIDKDLVRQVFDFFHAAECASDACDSWYELSSRRYVILKALNN